MKTCIARACFILVLFFGCFKQPTNNANESLENFEIFGEWQMFKPEPFRDEIDTIFFNPDSSFFKSNLIERPDSGAAWTMLYWGTYKTKEDRIFYRLDSAKSCNQCKKRDFNEYFPDTASSQIRINSKNSIQLSNFYVTTAKHEYKRQ